MLRKFANNFQLPQTFTKDKRLKSRAFQDFDLAYSCLMLPSFHNRLETIHCVSYPGTEKIWLEAIQLSEEEFTFQLRVEEIMPILVRKPRQQEVVTTAIEGVCSGGASQKAGTKQRAGGGREIGWFWRGAWAFKSTWTLLPGSQFHLQGCTY